MFGLDITEAPVQFGRGQRLFGILTEPGRAKASASDNPIFVFLSAGLLHRVGPSRLHVVLARSLATRGFRSIRIDLAGKGDSSARDGVTNQQSVAEDYKELRAELDSRYGAPKLVLVGLCSGADNAIRLSIEDGDVCGLVLLDPYVVPDRRFRIRAVLRKYGDTRRYLRKLKNLLASAGNRTAAVATDDNPLVLRDIPSVEQTGRALAQMAERNGRALAVFTQYALGYYNHVGQLRRAFPISEFDEVCQEVFWPDCEHTYKLNVHRERLIKLILDWAESFRATSPDPNL